MKIGIAAYHDLVANRIDFADRLKVYEIRDGQPFLEKELALPKINPLYDANAILSSGVEVIICGAINGFFFRMLAGKGLQVIPWIAGDVDSVLKRFMEGGLQPPLPTPRGFGMGRPMRFRKRCGRGRGSRRGRNF